MATRWAVASGNWSNTSTWNGGTLPAVDDDVWANGFNVTINQNVTVLSLRTTSDTFAAAGGDFGINNTLTVTANGLGFVSGTTRCLHFSFSGAASATAIGNAFGGSGVNAYGVHNASSATLTYIGNATGGSGSNANGVHNQGTGTVIMTGNATGGTNATARGAHNTTGIFTLNGIAIASDIAEAINNTTGTFTIAAARHASNGRSPWTGNGKILFSNLDLAHVTVNNAAHVSRMLGRRLLAPLGSFEGGFHG
jgi:hypothetical protein